MEKSNLHLIYIILKRYFRQYRKTLIFVLLLITATSGISLTIPYISKLYIDKALPSSNIAMMLYILLVYLVIILLTKTMSSVHMYVMSRLNMLVMMKMRKDIVSRIHRMPMHMFLEYSDEYLFNRATNDTVFIMDSFISSAISMLHSALIIIIGIIYIFSMNMYLSFVVVIMIFINIMVSQHWGRVLAKYNAPTIENYTIHSSSIQQCIRQTFLVKIFNLYHSNPQRMVLTFRSYYTVYSEYVKKTFISHFISGSIQDVARILIMLISGIMITRGRFTLGGLFAFLAYFDLINGPAVDIVHEYIAFVKNVPVYTRISELLTLPTEYPTNEVEELIFSHQVALSDATFYYDQSTIILDKQSIIFERGHIYLVNGPSGSGKTTMAMLLLGISRLKEGSVIYDGRELRDHNIESIRDQCAYVEQEPMMLHDTVYQNIRIGNLRAESDQVLQAAKKAHVDDFVKNLPAGYETKLGENGISLSTGQKQRIAIARCILREPKLIILDEPVSSVDPESESLIYKSIMDLADKMIVIIISHKFETNKLADIIVTLNDSKLTINMNK